MFNLEKGRSYHPGQNEVGHYGQENNNTGCDEVTKSAVLKGWSSYKEKHRESLEYFKTFLSSIDFTQQFFIASGNYSWVSVRLFKLDFKF